MKLKTCLPIAFILFQISLYSQKYTISGFISDFKNGERLIGASIYDQKSRLGTITNAYGFYSLTLPKGNYEITFAQTGYGPVNQEIELSSDITLNIDLNQEIKISEVTVVADKVGSKVESSQMSQVNLSTETIKSIPALLGEVDVIKAIQLLPGVQSGTEGTSGMYVRGGGPDQNLILLDGIPVYNVNHLFGFFSVFNADGINAVQLITGGFPARYGGRLSSVLDISMKEGNNSGLHGTGSIGIVASRLTLEGPIIKDKMTFIVSGRRTYIDILARPLIKMQESSDEKINMGYYFYDLNTKINYKFSDKSRLYLSAYMGNDKAYAKSSYNYQSNGNYSKEEFKLRWGNIIAALRWNYMFSNKVFSNTTLSYSRYQFLTGIEDESKYDGEKQHFKFSYISGIDDWAGKFELYYVPGPNHYFRFGVNNTYHTFNPGVHVYNELYNGNELDTTIGNKKIHANETFIYIEDEINLGKFKTNLGVHASGFYVDQKTYLNIEPRLSVRYLVNKNWSIKAAYTIMNQYIHLLTNSTIGLPTDLWLPVTDSIKPQHSEQYAIGSAIALKSGFELGIEAYYKKMDNLIEYKEGASFMAVNEDWQSKIEMGQGWSYGIEFLIRKNTGKTTGWIGYTLSWANRKFEAISESKIFPAKYDRRHDISFVLAHKFNEKVDMGLSWVFGSGNTATLPTEKYSSSTNYLSNYYYSEIEYFETRNNFRMPTYHRLDFSINLHKQKKRGTRTWSFGAYNAYSRKNPFFIYIDYDYNYQTNTEKKVVRQVSLFPIIPFISYQFKF